MSYMLDGHEVKVGDKLYDLVYGEVTVYYILLNKLTTKSKFGVDVCYNGNGILNYFQDTLNRTLFWSKPEFEIPKPPKKLVQKYKIVYTNDVGYAVSINYYKSMDDFNLYRGAGFKAIQLIEDSMIEVEE